MNLLMAQVVAIFLVAQPLAAVEKKVESKRVYIAVQQKDAKHKPFAASLSEALSSSLGKHKGYQVIAQDALADVIKNDADKQQQACDSSQAQCLESLGRSHQAELILTAQWAEIGDIFMLNLTLVESKNAKVIGRESCTAESQQGLLEQLPSTVSRLLGEGAVVKQKTFQFKIPAEGAKVAVMPLRAQNIKADVAASLTQVVAQEFKNFQGFSVISQDDIKAMLALESDKQMLGCTDVSCIAEIGGALGVDYLVSGSVGKVDETYVVSLKMIDSSKVRVLNRVNQSFTGRASDLLRAVKFASEGLVGVEQKGTGLLRIQVVPGDAEVSIDDHVQATLDAYALDPGRHRVLVDADGYYSAYLETYVRADATNTLQVNLEKIPAPWYAQWWAITAGSATLLTVAAGTAIAVASLVSNANPPATQGSVALSVTRGE